MNRQFKFLDKVPLHPLTADFIVLDLETTGLNPRKDQIVGVAFTTKPGVGFYTTDVEGLCNVVQKSKAQIVCHNAVFDMGFLKSKGFPLVDTHRVHDTMLLADLINPDRPTLKLKELAVELLGEGADSAAVDMYAWLTANGLEKGEIHRAPKEVLAAYAAEDAVNTYEIFVSLCKKVREIKEYFDRKGIKADLWNYYMRECVDLLPVVVSMQLGGVKLDLDGTALKQTELEARMGVLEQELNAANAPQLEKAEDFFHKRKIAERMKRNKSGKIKVQPPRVKFNWDSNDHLKYLFLTVYKLPITKKTQKGNASVDASFLETVKDKFPWIDKLLEYKELKKLTSTYLSGLLERQEGGFIHANFHMAGTATGRFSSSNPNLQNLPKHGGIKGLFIPRPDHKFIYADYSQLELRIAAHLSRDTEMCAEYAKDSDGTLHSDLHQRTADTLKIERAIAKNINFAIVYAASGWRIAEMMGWMDGIGLCLDPSGKCPWRDPCKNCKTKRNMAKKGDTIIENLFGKYVGLRNFLDKQKEFMLKYHITLSEFGKLRRLSGLKSDVLKEYNHALKAGFNLPIQSFGASLCKRSMVVLHRKGYRVVSNIHDALVVEVPENKAKAAMAEIKTVMESVFKLRVPLLVEPKILNSFEEKAE